MTAWATDDDFSPRPAAAPGELWVRESGPPDAPTVVLVHGAMDRSASMVRLSRLLDADHRVVRYDRRGYGRSKPHPGPFGIDQQVADLVGILAGRRAIVFGHSYGGNVALATAADHPDLVAAVVVYEAPMSWCDWWDGSTRGWVPSARPPEEIAERFMRRVVGSTTWERLPAKVQDERRREGIALDGELADLSARRPWSPEAIAAPVVVMRGELANERHTRAAVEMADVLAHDEPVVVAGAGHLGPATHPDAIAAVLRRLAAR